MHEDWTQEIPQYTVAFTTYIGFLVLILFGHLRDLLARLGFIKVKQLSEPTRTKTFVPLYQNFEAFYTRNLYRLVRDCWNRPICSAPGAEIDIVDRESQDHGWTFELTGNSTRVLNFGSYNYLGFAENNGRCAEEAERATRHYGLGVGSPRSEVGTLACHKELEELMSEFLGSESSLVFPMGFATNSLNIPALFGPNCCILSDELNHSSLILGSRLSGSTIKVFKHNNAADLETKVREAIIYGHSRTRRPFNKIVIVVEGIYSMEGTIVNLPEVIKLKKKYGVFLYLDEAHSIGALGAHGRGVIDYHNCQTSDIDILMGTFTKSFGGAGGYIAGTKHLIEYLKVNSYSTTYAASMPGPVALQILTSVKIIMNKNVSPKKCLTDASGMDRIKQLQLNTRYFRARLHHMRLIVYGHPDSPVIPILIYIPGKVPAFSREALVRRLGLVVVGFPATSILESRTRLCLSAAHTPQMIEKALKELDELADLFRLRYSHRKPPRWTYEAISDWIHATGISCDISEKQAAAATKNGYKKSN